MSDIEILRAYLAEHPYDADDWRDYWMIEGGKGTKGKIVKFQIRPDPLAR